MTDSRVLKILKANGENFRDFNEEAENLARRLNKLSYTQLRKVFEMIRKIEYEQKKASGDSSLSSNCLKSLLLLKPKLLYMTERQKGLAPLQEVVSAMIDELVRSKSIYEFENFISFLEAVVAYHFYFEKERRTRR